MELPARYHDGLVANVLDVVCRFTGTSLDITDSRTLAPVATWAAADVFPLHHRKNELRIGLTGKPYGARLIFSGYAESEQARAALPALAEKHRRDTGRQYKIVGLGTFALASVIVAYIFGVPLLAGQITTLIPTEWEQQFGAKVAEQVESALSEDGGFEVCDPNPNSLANRAITRFATAALEGAGSPFTPDVKVIRSTVPNAFALPGGKSFYFSALLDSTESPDEFAGVLAHELGHVAHRHAMEQLISSAATGLLIGFILGDMTGISVAGGLGSILIDSRFSREAEAQADRFSADTSKRLGFQPAALASLLERVASDDDFTRALALLSTHPLTGERRAALEALSASNPIVTPAFSPEEWAAIKAMCKSSAPRPTPISTPPATGTRPPPVPGSDEPPGKLGKLSSKG